MGREIPFVGVAGGFATILLDHLNSVLAFVCALVSIAWMLRRWYLFEKRRGKCEGCNRADITED